MDRPAQRRSGRSGQYQCTANPGTTRRAPIPPLARGDPTVSTSDGEKAAQGGGEYGGRVIEEQLRSGATRNKPIQPRLRTALDYASAQTGLEVRVGSGGQIEGRDPHHHNRPGGWTGSHRHDLGHAADFRLYDKDGKAVPINDPRHIAFAEHAARAGAGGGGSGYMGQYVSHIDLGTKAAPTNGMRPITPPLLEAWPHGGPRAVDCRQRQLGVSTSPTICGRSIQKRPARSVWK